MWTGASRWHQQIAVAAQKILKDSKVVEALSDDNDTNGLLALSLQIYSTFSKSKYIKIKFFRSHWK